MLSSSIERDSHERPLIHMKSVYKMVETVYEILYQHYDRSHSVHTTRKNAITRKQRTISSNERNAHVQRNRTSSLLKTPEKIATLRNKEVGNLQNGVEITTN